MKRIFLLGLALLAFAFAGSAQHREKARQLLDRLAADYRQAACLSIQFSGSQSGSGCAVYCDRFAAAGFFAGRTGGSSSSSPISGRRSSRRTRRAQR